LVKLFHKRIGEAAIHNLTIHQTAANRNHAVRMNEVQKESRHLDIIWLDVDEEEVPNNNTSRKPKAKSRETKHCADYTHLVFRPKPSDTNQLSTKSCKTNIKKDIIN
jgi:hypothetical protein